LVLEVVADHHERFQPRLTELVLPVYVASVPGARAVLSSVELADQPRRLVEQVGYADEPAVQVQHGTVAQRLHRR
jgi:hypothetical protein